MRLSSLLPHRPPMLLIETFVARGPDHGIATRVFRKGDYGLEGGIVSEPALIECVAQTAAALVGVDGSRRGLPPRAGFLAGIDDFEVIGPTREGAALEIDIVITRRLGPFFMAEGKIVVDGRPRAQGVFKFYLEGDLP